MTNKKKNVDKKTFFLLIEYKNKIATSAPNYIFANIYTCFWDQ